MADIPDIETLGAARYVSLRTFKRDGGPIDVPVWPIPHDGRLFLFTDPASLKARRIGRDPRIELSVCNANGKRILSGWATGHAAPVLDAALSDQAMKALRAKYGWQLPAIQFVQWLRGRADAYVIYELSVDAHGAQ